MVYFQVAAVDYHVDAQSAVVVGGVDKEGYEIVVGVVVACFA